MEQMLKESLDNFDAVWQRVTCPATPPEARQETASLEDILLGFIHDETCAAAYTAALARLFTGEGRTVLMRQAADARRHLKRLRAEHYIVAGAPAGGNQDCRGIAGKLASLRTVYLQAQDRAGRYSREAERAPDEIRPLFSAFAEEERRHAREARALLVDSF